MWEDYTSHLMRWVSYFVNLKDIKDSDANKLYQYALFISALYASSLKFANSDTTPKLVYQKGSAYSFVSIGYTIR